MNWVWEMAQMRGYVEMAGKQWQQTVAPCSLASLGDVLMTLAVYGIGALAAGQRRWGTTGTWYSFAAAAILGAILAVAYEWYSQWIGRWSYSDQMPILPVLNVGLWPVLQLVVLVPAALWIARWATQRKR